MASRIESERFLVWTNATAIYYVPGDSGWLESSLLLGYSSFLQNPDIKILSRVIKSLESIELDNRADDRPASAN